MSCLSIEYWAATASFAGACGRARSFEMSTGRSCTSWEWFASTMAAKTAVQVSRRMIKIGHGIASVGNAVHRTGARIALPLALLFGFAAVGESESAALEIAILKSSSIGAYEQAIEGFKAAGPSGAIYPEYDMQIGRASCRERV